MLTVVIANRNEPYLKQTCESIRAASGEMRVEILVVNDGIPERRLDVPRSVRVETPWKESRGCQAARDWGIVNAKNDATCIIDGHMDFDKGIFEHYAKTLAEHPNVILCAHCPGLNPETWTREPHICSGAYVIWKDPPTCLSLKWRYVCDTGEVPAVLGACYGISRSWYINGLRRPWQHGTGWGCDEELISIVNWLCGGQNLVTPFDAAHWFRDNSKLPYAHTASSLAGIWANRIRMVQMLPMPPEMSKPLLDMMMSCGPVADILRHVSEKVIAGEAAATEYRNWLAGMPRKFTDWRKEWCCESDPTSAPSLIPAGCRRESAPLPLASTVIPPPPPEIRAPQKTQRPIVHDPGVACPHCGERYGHLVINTYPNENRGMRCSRCGMPFISIRTAVC